MENLLILLFFEMIAKKEICVIGDDPKPTKSCAVSIQEYESRSRSFNCSTRTYICILTEDNLLVETCMWNRPIEPGKVGCPYLVEINEEAGPLIDAKLKTCNVVGCPEKDHQRYMLSELYKYPACFLQANERTMAKTSTRVPKEMSTVKGGNGIAMQNRATPLPHSFASWVFYYMFAFFVIYSICQQY